MSYLEAINDEIKKNNERRRTNIYGNDDIRRFSWGVQHKELFDILCEKNGLNLMTPEKLCALCLSLGHKHGLNGDEEQKTVATYKSNAEDLYKRTRTYSPEKELMTAIVFDKLTTEDNDIDLGHLENTKEFLTIVNEYLEGGMKYLIEQLAPFIQIKNGKVISTIGNKKAEFIEYFFQFINNESLFEIA